MHHKMVIVFDKKIKLQLENAIYFEIQEFAKIISGFFH